MRIRFFSVILAACICQIAYADQTGDRLTKLENTIQSIQTDSVSRNENVASALATIDQIKQDYQLIQGEIEANNHLIKELQSEVTRLKHDISNRLLMIEERLDIYDQQITKAVAKVVPAAANEADMYQKALDLVHKSDFLTAVASFRTFLKTYSKSDLADNAQYWIGECYYALKDFQKAIKEFQVVAEKYPKSDKVAGATLKQGFSFAELGMLEEAKTFLSTVMKNYSGSDEAVKAKEKLDRMEQKEDTPSNIPLAPGVKQQQQKPTEKPTTGPNEKAN